MPGHEWNRSTHAAWCQCGCHPKIVQAEYLSTRDAGMYDPMAISTYADRLRAAVQAVRDSPRDDGLTFYSWIYGVAWEAIQFYFEGPEVFFQTMKEFPIIEDGSYSPVWIRDTEVRW